MQIVLNLGDYSCNQL